MIRAGRQEGQTLWWTTTTTKKPTDLHVTLLLILFQLQERVRKNILFKSAITLLFSASLGMAKKERMLHWHILLPTSMPEMSEEEISNFHWIRKANLVNLALISPKHIPSWLLLRTFRANTTSTSWTMYVSAVP